MNKVVLIRPRRSKNRPRMPRLPLALLYMGTILKVNGYEVKIIDSEVEENYEGIVANECKDALLVGVTALTSQVNGGLEISDFIKKQFDVPIVWGGVHPTLFPELTYRDNSIDYAVVGEGEYAILELVKSVKSCKPLDDIEGLVWKNGGSVKINKARPYINLNESPSVDYTLIDMGKYFKDAMWRKAVDVQTSRGCPNRCLYCIHSILKDHKVRFLNASRVVDECERLVTEYGADYITFVDDNFFVNKKRAKDICLEIIRRKLKFNWFAEVRADYFRDGFIDSEFLELAEASGLTNLTIGAESGVQRFLNLIGKEITVEEIMNSAMVLSKTNIIAAYSFIIGLPDETVDDIFATWSFIEKLQRIYPRAVYGIGVLRAYPGSELTEGFVKQGYIKEPNSLRQFADYEYSKVYTDEKLIPVWHCAPHVTDLVARYSVLAYSVLGGTTISKHLKYASVLLLPERVLQKIARWRLHNRFLCFPIDLYISKLLHTIYLSRTVKGLIRWKQ